MEINNYLRCSVLGVSRTFLDFSWRTNILAFGGVPGVRRQGFFFLFFFIFFFAIVKHP